MSAKSHARWALVAIVTTVLSLGFIVPAHAASTPSVSLSTSHVVAAPGAFVKFTGSVSKSSAKARIILQRHNGSRWETIAASKVSKKRTYSFNSRAATGRHWYRVYVYKNKKIRAASSVSRPVQGWLRTGDCTPSANVPVSIGMQLPTAVARPGELQRWDGGNWVRIVGFTSATNGAGIATATFPSDTSVRVYAPAATVKGVKYSAWLSAGETISVAPLTDEQIIWKDVNCVRALAGKGPLILDSQLSSVARNWSKFLHDNQEFYHNPNYSSQIRAGWRRAGENIAAGQQANTVVEAWRNSPGHYKNMIGDYTHIGVGIYEGPYGYKRYFTNNFGKY